MGCHITCHSGEHERRELVLDRHRKLSTSKDRTKILNCRISRSSSRHCRLAAPKRWGLWGSSDPSSGVKSKLDRVPAFIFVFCRTANLFPRHLLIFYRSWNLGMALLSLGSAAATHGVPTMRAQLLHETVHVLLARAVTSEKCVAMWFTLAGIRAQTASAMGHLV